MTDGTPDLTGICEKSAADLEDVTSATDGDVVTWSRAEFEFARASTTALEVRLPVDIAEAAMRTPDTAAAKEAGWLRFTPRDGEPHVIDRAEAWFHTAWRHATKG